MNKSLAYIIGVFLGDGSIGALQNRFTLEVIDKDFAEKTSKCLQNLFPDKEIKVKEVYRNYKGYKNKVRWRVQVSSVKFCRELYRITEGKKHLPKDFEKWDKTLQNELISGLLDSEGWVGMRNVHYNWRNDKIFDMSIGIGACDIWLYELYFFLQKYRNAKVGKLNRTVLKSGKIFAKFSFNKKWFVKSGLYFNIFRKQQRIENYKILFPGSTTKRDIPFSPEHKRKISEYQKRRIRTDAERKKMSISAKKRVKRNVRNSKGQFVKGNNIV